MPRGALPPLESASGLVALVWGKKKECRLGDGEINTVNSNHLEMATSDQVQMSSLLILRKVMEAANVAGVEHPCTQGEMAQEMGDAIHTKQGI